MLMSGELKGFIAAQVMQYAQLELTFSESGTTAGRQGFQSAQLMHRSQSSNLMCVA